MLTNDHVDIHKPVQSLAVPQLGKVKLPRLMEFE